MINIKNWFYKRVPIDGEQLIEFTNEPVPQHMKRWWFCLGGTPAYLFLVQIVTGIMLAFYYQATPDSAYESVEYISKSVSYGWFFRSLHKWAATLMIASIILHQMRVYFTGGYRQPRELNWVIGMCLLMCTLVIGFTGYSLVFEELSYWGAEVGANIGNTVPIIGPFLKHMLLGGAEYNEHTLSRFYVMHAAVLPGTMIVLLGMHVTLIRLHGITEQKDSQEESASDKPSHFNFFPDHVYTEIIVGLVLMLLLSFLATVLPAHLGEKANPLVTPEMIKPEWWFYVTFRWLKIFSGTFAVLSMGFIVGAMFVWPWIETMLQRITGNKEISVYIGILATLLLIGLTMWEAIAPH